MAMKITDLPLDALSNILASVAKLSDGAADIAKSLSVCKHFLVAGNNNIVYKAVCFQKVEVVSQYRLFQRTDGLLFKCASAGNLFAQYLLAQVIFKSSTQLKRFGIKSATLKNFREYRPRSNNARHIKYQKEYLVASFMASIVPGQDHRPFLYHWELVKVFLSNSTHTDIYTMHRDIQTYVEYFTGNHIHRGTDASVFLSSLYSLCNMDPHNKYIWQQFMYARDYHYRRHRRTSFDCATMRWKNAMGNATAVREEIRVRALHAFDRVSRVFPGFVVSEERRNGIQ